MEVYFGLRLYTFLEQFVVFVAHCLLQIGNIQERKIDSNPTHTTRSAPQAPHPVGQTPSAAPSAVNRPLDITHTYGTIPS